MTTPPKARVYHISREESVLVVKRDSGAAETARKVQVELRKRDDIPGAADLPANLFANEDDGFEGMSFPGAAANQENGPNLAARIAAVKAENLTSRQFRMARRIAAMHEIPAKSDEEAVIALRDRGIDPFQRTALGTPLADEGARPTPAEPRNLPVPQKGPGLPRKRGSEIMPIQPAEPRLPARESLSEEKRAAEIMRIQRDIARRRRRNVMMLAARLLIFVGIPTFLAGLYYFNWATSLYATHSQFQIQQADSGGGASAGGLFGAGAMAANTDSVSVQSYLTSRDAMLRLDQELGFKAAFQDPSVDFILRLPPDVTNEQTYKLYLKSVQIGYDPTEGVINMEVIAPNAALSQQFSTALIKYAEGQVDQLTARLRADQMKGSVESYEDAEAKVRDAQARVQELQEKLGVLDPQAESSVVMARVSDLERQLSAKRLELGQLESNRVPNRSRVDGVKGDIERLEQMMAETRSQLTEGNNARGSLATISGQIRIAESDLKTRQELLAAAATQMETARIEANKQVRYLSLSVAPIAPDEATYPKAFQNTIVAFLIFSGIYLMLSLTASILREQVSS